MVEDIVLRVNGVAHRLRIGAEVTLLDALRDKLHLFGTKRGCDLGQCGVCTVLADGQRINACLALAVRMQDVEITTIEGLGRAEDDKLDGLHPVQRAFVRHDAFQCGYCTPGQIMSSIGLINEGRGHDPAEIRKHMSGNLCRCGAYANIIDAIVEAASELQGH